MFENRTTPLICGNVPGSNGKDDPQWSAGNRYTTDTYRRAIARACDQAFPVPLQVASERAFGRNSFHPVVVSVECCDVPETTDALLDRLTTDELTCSRDLSDSVLEGRMRTMRHV